MMKKERGDNERVGGAMWACPLWGPSLHLQSAAATEAGSTIFKNSRLRKREQGRGGCASSCKSVKLTEV